MASDVMTKPHQLIASDRVEGTAVRRPNGDMIGHIERLMIDKVGTRVAADTGGAIKGRRLDIWEPSVAACTRFGRRQLRVWQAA